MPDQTTVASTEFQTRAGLYIEQAATSPVFITKHRRPVRVLLNIEEYERLKARDTRQVFYPHELPSEVLEALDKAEYGPIDPALEKLMS